MQANSYECSQPPTLLGVKNAPLTYGACSKYARKKKERTALHRDCTLDVAKSIQAISKQDPMDIDIEGLEKV